MKCRGISLIELLVAITVTAIATIAAAQVLAGAADIPNRVIPSREAFLRIQRFESDLQTLIRRAMVAGPDDSTDTFFIMSAGDGSTIPSTGNTSANQLIFTAKSAPVSQLRLDSTDDFELQNQKFAPAGGITEVEISGIAIDAPEDVEGLLLRTQTPSDGDPTQGGFQQVMIGDLVSIGFEAFDGLEWIQEWDTTTSTTPRLPAAIRVSYELQGDNGQQHEFVVRLPLSDVTPENPVVTESASLIGGAR